MYKKKWLIILISIIVATIVIPDVHYDKKTDSNETEATKETSANSRNLRDINSGADIVDMMPKADMVTPAGKSEPSPFMPEPKFGEILKVQPQEFMPVPDFKISSIEGLTIKGHLGGECLIKNEGKRALQIRLVSQTISYKSEKTISMSRLEPGDQIKQGMTADLAYYIYNDEGELVDFLRASKLSPSP